MADSAKDEDTKADNEEVVVQVSDLEVIKAALHNASGLSLARDMEEAYRYIDTSGRTSNLTRSLEEATNKVTAYLKIGEESDE